MPRYWTFSRTDGTPADANRHEWVNDERLPEGAAHVHRDVLGVATEKDLTVRAISPGGLSDWMVVELEADAELEIVPDASEALAGLFVSEYVEVARTPALEWLEALKSSDDKACAAAATRALVLATKIGARAKA